MDEKRKTRHLAAGSLADVYADMLLSTSLIRSGGKNNEGCNAVAVQQMAESVQFPARDRPLPLIKASHWTPHCHIQTPHVVVK